MDKLIVEEDSRGTKDGGAQQAAEAEVARQGAPAGILAQQGVNFVERGVEILLPAAIVVCLVTLASANDYFHQAMVNGPASAQASHGR